LVTGGGSGIGREICQRLAREGHRVAVLDLNGDGAEETTKLIDSGGGRALAFTVDISDRAQVDDVVQAVKESWGPTELLVNCAAFQLWQPFGELTLDQWNRVLAVNLTGSFNCAQAVLPDMVASAWGRIVLISSSSAQRGGPNMVAYASSKGGVIAMTKSLALEYAGTGVTVNNIAPSAVYTPSMQKKVEAGLLRPADELAERSPVKRLGVPEDIAYACSFLCSDESSYITGQTLSVNGGSFVGW
jgi:2-hydroxycyclohexanecarboxyl-CoA dehydrogenase